MTPWSRNPKCNHHPNICHCQRNIKFETRDGHAHFFPHSGHTYYHRERHEPALLVTLVFALASFFVSVVQMFLFLFVEVFLYLGLEMALMVISGFFWCVRRAFL